MDGVDGYTPSPNKHGGRRGRNVVALVFHDEEYPEQRGSARTVAGMFSRASFAASTQVAIDAGEVIGCVDYGDTAWHTGAGYPYNEATEGAEHDGYAHQSRDEWLDPYGVELLERSARWFAWRCTARGIPPRVIDAGQLRQAITANDPAQGGIVGHNTITRAAGVAGGHTDPGGAFPWDYFAARVAAHHGGAAGPPPAPTNSDLVLYRRNADARLLQGDTLTLQRLLTIVALGAGVTAMDPGTADGLFGPRTEAAVLEFQRRAYDTDGAPLVVDGVVGPMTWTALHVCAYLAQTGQAAPSTPHADAVPVLPYPLRLGMRGDAYVRQWQQCMADRGRALAIDGNFGPETKATCVAFQHEKGLDADGVVGPLTWQASWT